ncbi:PepSY domain-containing protein [Aliivibrio wodanis]|uniref:PepSY domain-containing protein n=1 Tax=Aliivibrio wodanis TaxID=80852 RepID=UPI00406C28E7
MLKKPAIYLAALFALLPLSQGAFANDHPDGHQLIQDVQKNGAKIDIDEDQDEVYDAVQAGLVKPFSDLYSTVEKDFHGRIIKVELDEDDNEWTYELKLVHDNNIIKVEYNAATLAITEIKGRDIRAALK